MQKKVYEDYEPISNIGICSALLTVLSVATYMGVFSGEKETSEDTKVPSTNIIQKADNQPILIKQKENNQKERSN